jgi:hypothetical protein
MVEQNLCDVVSVVVVASLTVMCSMRVTLVPMDIPVSLSIVSTVAIAKATARFKLWRHFSLPMQTALIVVYELVR